MFTKLNRNEVLMAPHMIKASGWGQYKSRGPLSKKYSLDRKATATNRMHSNDLEADGKKCC